MLFRPERKIALNRHFLPAQRPWGGNRNSFHSLLPADSSPLLALQNLRERTMFDNGSDSLKERGKRCGRVGKPKGNDIARFTTVAIDLDGDPGQSRFNS